MVDLRTASGTASDASGVSSDLGKNHAQQLTEGGIVAKSVASLPASGPAAANKQEVKRAMKAATPGKKQAEERIYKQFRQLMDALVEEIDKAPDYVENDVVTNEGSSVTVEVDELLRRVAEIPWGQGESLKLAVTVLRIPTRNARWTPQHIQFLQEAARLLRVQYLIDSSTVGMLKQLLKAYGLDIFRGSVTQPEVLRRYKIIEAGANE